VKTWLLDKLAAALLARTTLYFHLNGYMNRWWLVPYRQVITRTITTGSHVFTTGDGTGPVSFWRRPIAWLFQRFDIAIRVHEILRSDTGRDPHDHPWPYLTIILRGGYWEVCYNDAGEEISFRWHGPGSILYRPAGSWHRLILPKRHTCTTLFITGKKAQSWGFLVAGEKVPYYTYLGKD
jgi:hypothetical protein